MVVHPPGEISPPKPQRTPSFPGASSTARCHPGVSRLAPRAICPSRSQISCREPLRRPEVHAASWCGNNLTTQAVPQTCSPQLRHANSPSQTPDYAVAATRRINELLSIPPGSARWHSAESPRRRRAPHTPISRESPARSCPPPHRTGSLPANPPPPGSAES